MSNVRNFGATGDGKTDDTEALAHAVTQGDGVLELPRGNYLINSPILVPTSKSGRASITGKGGVAKVIMNGPGPAFIITGTHGGTADPLSFKPNVWQSERMPTIENVEIEGRDPAADGVRIEGTMQAIFQGVAIRNCRHAIHIAKRNRNVLISNCQIYYNTGVGVLIDQCNLHQINITGNHISYNRLGGIRIQKSEVRNLQITGNDIEYNNHRAHKTKPAPTAEIFIDCSDGKATVREGTIASNTIQATESEGGANVRLLGSSDNPLGSAGMWAITGNLIGSQQVNIDLQHSRAITITGNVIYSGHRANIHAQHCENLVIASNSLDHNHAKSIKLPVHVRFDNCKGLLLTGNIIHDHPTGVFKDDKHAAKGTVVFNKCERVTVTGCQITDANRDGLHFDTCELVSVSSSTISETRDKTIMKTAVRFIGKGKHNLVAGNTFAKGADGAVVADRDAGVRQENNIVAD